MANTRSAIKRIRSSARKRARNTLVRSSVRTAVKKANSAVQGESAEGAEAVKRAISELDRAASKGVIHKNNAARRKSRLMRRLKYAGEFVIAIVLSLLVLPLILLVAFAVKLSSKGPAIYRQERVGFRGRTERDDHSPRDSSAAGEYG